jgi:hypothetical protein
MRRMMPAMNQELQQLLWFGGGFALAAVLSVSYEAVNYVPVAVAFGLLCFGCGVLLVMFLSLRSREAEFAETTVKSSKTSAESFTRWSKEFEELRNREAELQKEKEAFDAEKAEFESERLVWNALHSDEPKREEPK